MNIDLKKNNLEFEDIDTMKNIIIVGSGAGGATIARNLQ